MSKEIEEIKICTGCGRFSDDPINSIYLGCCPDNNYVSLKIEFTIQQQEIEQLKKEIERLEDNEVILADEVIRLGQENTILKEAMQWFIDRCDKGEVRSKKTYARFKELLTK